MTFYCTYLNDVLFNHCIILAFKLYFLCIRFRYLLTFELVLSVYKKLVCSSEFSQIS